MKTPNKSFNLPRSIIKCYIPNNTASKYLKQKLTELQRNTGIYRIVVEDFNTLLSEVDRLDLKIKTDRADLDKMDNKPDLVEICRILYPLMVKNTHYF